MALSGNFCIDIGINDRLSRIHTSLLPSKINIIIHCEQSKLYIKSSSTSNMEIWVRQKHLISVDINWIYFWVKYAHMKCLNTVHNSKYFYLRTNNNLERKRKMLRVKYQKRKGYKALVGVDFFLLWNVQLLGWQIISRVNKTMDKKC